jgi:hypothetical protein
MKEAPARRLVPASPRRADRKIGVLTRAGARLFAMEHGLNAWGELPISRPAAHP